MEKNLTQISHKNTKWNFGNWMKYEKKKLPKVPFLEFKMVGMF